MILWCSKCSEYRKMGTSDWKECKVSSRHTMVPANEKINAEIRQIKDRIDGPGKTRDDDLSRLGALEALKNAEGDEFDEKGRLAVLAEKMIEGYACLDGDADEAFFWVRHDGTMDVLKHDSSRLTRILLDAHWKKYGEFTHDFYARGALATHHLRAGSEGGRVDRIWKCAGHDGHTLWVDLGGHLRTLYGISAESNGPAVPYSPDVRIVIERHGARMPSPEYREGKWLDRFCDLVRIPDGQRALFAAHTCHMFCMHQETPAMLISGPPDSGKTWAARMVRELVDPIGLKNAVSVMKKTDYTAKALVSQPVISFNDVRNLRRNVANMLAGMLEGTASGREPSLNARIIMAVPEGKPKLLHSLEGRTLRYELPPVKYWKTGEELAAEFYGMRPHLLYEIFGLLHRAFGEPPGARQTTRMADFEVLGRAVAKHSGHGENAFVDSLQSVVQGMP